jgi:hypothetical protein
MSLGVLAFPQPSRAAGETFLYLPLISRNYNPLAGQRIVNAPFLNTTDIMGQKFDEMAIFWFGKVGPTENYTDVRVGYNSTELVIYTATIDRRLWYDTTPAVGDLTTWDSVTVLLDLDGVVDGRPTSNTFRFDAQLTNGGTISSSSKATYIGNGTTFVAQSVPFTGISGWRGGTINNDGDDKGWVMTFRIPFSSLGLAGAPAQGAAMWGLSVFTHDRDDFSGTPIADTYWPESADLLTPSSWGRLAWGLQPAYVAPPSTGPNSLVTIKHKLNGVTVKDANVGGHTVCGGGFDFWTQWGNVNDKDYNGGSPNPVFNVQNQSDISDYPCFAKIYLSFPLNTVPANKVIKSATLTLYQTGGSGPASNGQGPYPQLIQVISFAEDFTDTSLTWNNAPLALRNYARTSVPPQAGCGSSIPWPCTPRTWEVSQLVAEAYQQSKPARIVLYSADSNYSTGKHFTSSDTGDWNEAGRPKLTIEYGNP